MRCPSCKGHRVIYRCGNDVCQASGDCMCDEGADPCGACVPSTPQAAREPEEAAPTGFIRCSAPGCQRMGHVEGLCLRHGIVAELALDRLEVVAREAPPPAPPQGPLCLGCGEERLGGSAFCWAHRAEFQASKEWRIGLLGAEHLAQAQAAFAARLRATP